MDCPRHIETSASPLFLPDKSSAEYKALLLIATLPHPLRPILATFVLAAVDRENAARYLLDETSGSEAVESALEDFVADWITLANAMRPTLASNLNEHQVEVLRRRDGGVCCFSRPQDTARRTEDLLLAYIIPPNVFEHPQMNKNAKLYQMLDVFIGEEKIKELHSVIRSASDVTCFHQAFLLSKDAFELFENGQLSLNAMKKRKAGASIRFFISTNHLLHTAPEWVSQKVISMIDKSTDGISPPNPLLFEVHHRFSDVLSWIQVAEYMMSHTPEHIRSGTNALGPRLLSPFFRALRFVWRQLSASVRAAICQRLRSIGYRTYGPTLSDRIYRLPFGIYLRFDRASEASRHLAEFETLRLVEKHTTIPAPRPIDAFQYKEKSYLLMTRVPGRPIGTLLHGMTDMQLQTATKQLTEYIAQLRSIPNTKSDTVRICNSLGAGIMDWRIGDSRRRELTFITVADFHQCLTAGYSQELQKKATPSHTRSHEIVFTHGDINPRNILADESGTITGIVDWENSGWFPEYWEYTKAHFAVRYNIRWVTDVVDQLFTGYREELQVEKMLADYAPYI